MMAFFANIFGYLLNFIYNFIGNYGISIIFFCIIVKALMLPISIKQQKSVKASAKIQKKMKEIQFEYKSDPEKLNQATMELYREEKISPFSGCLSAILQIVLIISVFYLVRSPLTYMKKIDSSLLDKYKQILSEENLNVGNGYPEIDILREISNLKNIENENISQEELDSMQINMDFFGLDLSQIPSKNASNKKVFIIPLLYVLMSIISMRITTMSQNNSHKTKLIEAENKSSEEKQDDENNKESSEDAADMSDFMNQMNKNMTTLLPITYLGVALIAPLGLALYWLVNSILIIGERLLLNKIIKDEEN